MRGEKRVRGGGCRRGREWEGRGEGTWRGRGKWKGLTQVRITNSYCESKRYEMIQSLYNMTTEV